MNINVSEIIEEKIKELDENKVIENVIKDTIEKTVKRAFENALDSWDLRNDLEKKVKKEVMQVAENIDFQTYNSFMLDSMKHVINEVCREDLCNKAEKHFKDMFLCQTKEIKLSSIFERYREIACNYVEEPEKWDRADEGWHYKFEIEDDRWIRCELDYEERSYYSRTESNIAFSIYRDYKDKNIGKISSLYLDGKYIKDTFKLAHLNDVELLLVQASLNEIPIIIDVEDEDDIDNSFDVDY